MNKMLLSMILLACSESFASPFLVVDARSFQIVADTAEQQPMAVKYVNPRMAINGQEIKLRESNGLGLILRAFCERSEYKKLQLVNAETGSSGAKTAGVEQNGSVSVETSNTEISELYCTK